MLNWENEFKFPRRGISVEFSLDGVISLTNAYIGVKSEIHSITKISSSHRSRPKQLHLQIDVIYPRITEMEKK